MLRNYQKSFKFKKVINVSILIHVQTLGVFKYTGSLKGIKKLSTFYHSYTKGEREVYSTYSTQKIPTNCLLFPPVITRSIFIVLG